jgi:cytochrome c
MMKLIINMIAAAGLVLAGSVMAEDMPALAKKSGCTACHTVDKKLVGPAWADVGKAYNTTHVTSTGMKTEDILQGKSAEDYLVEKVSKGGSGNWGKAKMIPNSPKVSEADIRELVKFELSHK